MNYLKNHYYHLICLLFGMGLIAVGIIVLAQGSVALSYAAYIGGGVIFVHGAVTLVQVFAKRKTAVHGQLRSLILSGSLNIATGVLVFLLPYFAVKLVFIFFTLYGLLNALVKLIDFDLDLRDKSRCAWQDMGFFLLFFSFTVLMIFLPEMGERAFLIIAGVYLILYGASEIYDFIIAMIPQQRKNRIRRRIRISIPMLLTSFKPLFALHKQKRKEILEPDGETPKLETVYAEGKEELGPPDIEVLIHVSDNGVGKMGHCDLFFDGQVYSYGSYDVKTIRLFGGLGDGIFFTADKERYIRYAVCNYHKTIFGYGLHLTEEQKEQIRSEITKLRSNTIRWECPLERALKTNPAATQKDAPDFGSALWNATAAEFYKFRDGKFKTYFVLTSNCVLLADQLLAPAGVDIIALDGMMSPGSYYDYLDGQLARKESNVICKTVYNSETTAEWSEKKPLVPFE